MIDDLIAEAIQYACKKNFDFSIRKPIDSCHYSLAQIKERETDEAIKVLDEVLCPNRGK